MSKTLKASLMLGLAGVSYGLFLSLMKIANNHGFMREDLMVGQYMLAALILGTIMIVRHRQKLTAKQVLKLFLVGVFGFACSFCMYETVALTSTAFAVTMLFQYVWIGIVFDCILRRKFPSKLVIMATVLVILGTPFATGLLSDSNNITLESLLWGIGSAVSYAIMLMMSSRFETQLPSVTRTFYFSVAEMILAIVISPQFFTTVAVDPFVLVFVVPISLVSVVIPCLLIMKGSPMVPMGITTIMTGIELPSAIFFGAIFLGEIHNVSVIAGVLLICSGIIVANWDSIVELRLRKRAERLKARSE